MMKGLEYEGHQLKLLKFSSCITDNEDTERKFSFCNGEGLESNSSGGYHLPYFAGSELSNHYRLVEIN